MQNTRTRGRIMIGVHICDVGTTITMLSTEGLQKLFPRKEQSPRQSRRLTIALCMNLQDILQLPLPDCGCP